MTSLYLYVEFHNYIYLYVVYWLSRGNYCVFIFWLVLLPKGLWLETNGFTSLSVSSDINILLQFMEHLLSNWHCTLQGKKGVWLKLPVEKCDLVPIAVKVLTVNNIRTHSFFEEQSLYHVPLASDATSSFKPNSEVTNFVGRISIPSCGKRISHDDILASRWSLHASF